MAEIKIGLVLAYFIGIPMGIFAFIANLDSWKSTAVFIVVMVYWVGMIYFGFRRKKRLEIKEKLDIRQQQLDIMEREQQVRKKKV